MSADLSIPDNGDLLPCGEEEEADIDPEEEELTVQLGATYPCKRTDGTYLDAEVVKLRMNKRAGREEYYVHYAGLARRQAEWVDKTRLVLSKPAEEEEDMENGKTEDEETTQNPKSEEDEPEAKRVKGEPCVKVAPPVMCLDHDEKLKLFCKDDGALCCIICRDSLKHAGHKFLPVEDAVEVYQAELPTLVNPLEEALKEVTERTKQQRERKEQLKNSMTECRQHVMSEFGNLNNFLKERKEKLLEQLKKQSQCLLEEMETNAAKMEEKRDSLREAFAVASEKVDETEPVTFLDGIMDLIKQCKEQQRAQSAHSVIDKQLCPGTFNGPIQYIAWSQMKSFVPVPESKLQPQPQKKVLERPVDPPVVKDSGNLKSECVQQPTPPEEKKKESIPIRSAESLKKAAVSESSVASQAVISSVKKTVWFLGSGFLKSANRRAEKGPLGLNLGFDKQTCNLRWVNLNETWYGFFSKFKHLRNTMGSPDVVVLHTGSNNIGTSPFKVLVKTANNILRTIPKMYYSTVFIIGAVLPQPEWWGTNVEAERNSFNRFLAERADALGALMLKHSELEKQLIRRYTKGDTSPPTDDEVDLFLSDIRDALQKALLRVGLPILLKPVASPSGNNSSENAQSKDPVKAPQPSSTAKKTNSDVAKARDIWIIGNSYIQRASMHAERSAYGKNLGFDEKNWIVHWMGKTIQRSSLLSDMHFACRKLGMPSIVYLHVGSNDLGETHINTLIEESLYDIGRLPKLFPKTQFIFSTILPRVEWLSNSLEMCRKKFNTAVSQFAKKCGFEVAYNNELEGGLMNEFKGGRVFCSLNYNERDIFVSNIKLSLLMAMLKEKPVADKQDPQKEVSSTDGTDAVPDNAHAATTEDDEEEAATVETM